MEYAKETKQNKLTAKNFKANMIKHTQQMETLIKSTTDAMKEMMTLIKNDKKEPSSQTNVEKKKKREEMRKKYNDEPVCKHCGKKHPAKAEDECWELEKNKDSRPANWKKKHLKVHGAQRIRDMAAGECDIK